jgi:hypothetical protein
MNKAMSNQTQSVTSHASSTGRLFIKEEEFFRSAKIKAIVEKLLKSSTYRAIKHKETTKNQG